MGIAYLAAQLFGTVLLTHLLKMGVDRMRPHAHTDAATGVLHGLHASFPSSHTVDVAIGAFFVLMLVRAHPLRLLAVAAALSMGLARLVLGRHYTSDVLAGLALGAATAGAVVQVYLLPRLRQHAPCPCTASAPPSILARIARFFSRRAYPPMR